VYECAAHARARGSRVAQELYLVHQVKERFGGLEVDGVVVSTGKRQQVGREPLTGLGGGVGRHLQRLLGEHLAELGALEQHGSFRCHHDHLVRDAASLTSRRRQRRPTAGRFDGRLRFLHLHHHAVERRVHVPPGRGELMRAAERGHASVRVPLGHCVLGRPVAVHVVPGVRFREQVDAAATQQPDQLVRPVVRADHLLQCHGGGVLQLYHGRLVLAHGELHQHRGRGHRQYDAGAIAAALRPYLPRLKREVRVPVDGQPERAHPAGPERHHLFLLVEPADRNRDVNRLVGWYS